ncbi:MAG TPA: hypothetical protein VLX56_06630 [Nitrososphaerales archaeon]|nr:hypothetical protein [Nitrososphaerales archaeon]
MLFEGAIFLAAMGITTLEVVETAAVALALYAHSGRGAVFLFSAMGTAAVFGPMFVLGALIALLPGYIVEVTAGVLLLYFGLRLVRSGRRAVVNARRGGARSESFEKGELVTAFSVGAVEAFEAAIVLVGLLPMSFQSTVLGMAGGIGVVVVSAYVLRDQVRKVKQADMKIVVSALLLSFSTFWFVDVVTPLDEIALVPLFAVYAAAVYLFANRPSPPA